jgi:hypothetical protein
VQCGLKQSGNLFLISVQQIRDNIAFIVVFALKVELDQEVFYMRSYRVTVPNLIRIKYVIQSAERDKI